MKVAVRILALLGVVGLFAALLFRYTPSPDSLQPVLSTSATTATLSPSLPRANRDYVRPPLPQQTTPTYAVPLVAPTTHSATPRPTTAPAPAPTHKTVRVHTPAPTGRWRSIGVQDVTMYCATGNRNSAGLWPRIGDVAVLDRSIPFGTRVRISGRVYIVRDWVGHGTDFDIYNGSGGCESSALNFGRHHERVEIAR